METAQSPSPPVDTTDRVNAIVLPTFAIIAILIVYFPLKSFWRNRNFPAANLVMVGVIQNLIIFTNAIIWPNGDWSTWWSGTGYCDIVSYIRIPITTCVATSLYGLTRTLVNALDIDKHNFIDTPAMRRRILIKDIFICWTLPILQIGLYYLVQASRYGIMPVYGCTNLMDASWLEILIMYPWALLFSLVSAFHAIMIMCRLRKLRTDLSRALSSSNSGFTARRYLKLFIIACFLLVVLLPIEAYCLYVNMPKTINDYSFARTHNPLAWNAVVFFSTSDIPNLQYYGWFSIALCFQVFAFFGFTNESIDSYRKGLIRLGFGFIWPSLKESRESRRLRMLSERGSTSTLSGHFDLVGKALKYFEGSRKSSQATTVFGSDYTVQSRKGSQATCDTIALASVKSNTTSSPHKIISPSSSSVDPSSTYRSFEDVDAITPAATFDTTTSILNPIQELPPIATPPQNRSILSTWRTHLHLPFPLFNPKPHHNKPTQETTDIEAQTQQLEKPHLPIRKSSLSHITNPASHNISTVIWSEPSMKVHATANMRSSNLSAAGRDEEEPVDPLSPKMGSRAYRERERREMERDRRKARDVIVARKNAEMGGKGGVVKTTMMEISEEGGDAGSSFHH